MSPLTVVLIALGVSADAFAVSVGKGLQLTRLRWSTAAAVALTFGVFQAVMPLVGYLLAFTLRDLVTALDHWIAFVLLVALGARMIRGALGGDSSDDSSDGASHGASPGAGDGSADGRVAPGELLLLGVATSIDALAVGISLAFLEVDIWSTAALIGATTVVLSLAGVLIGHRAGTRIRGPAEIAGGLILIAIGVKVLLDHLGVW